MTIEPDLAVRVARAEIERDAALERARRAEELIQALMTKDEEAIIDTLHILGIPARDLRDIYQIVHEWHQSGGRPSMLELYRELSELRGAKA